MKNVADQIIKLICIMIIHIYLECIPVCYFSKKPPPNVFGIGLRTTEHGVDFC